MGPSLRIQRPHPDPAISRRGLVPSIERVETVVLVTEDAPLGCDAIVVRCGRRSFSGVGTPNGRRRDRCDVAG